MTFDPTPSAGRVEPVRTGLTAQLQKYAEALELVWFQYVVGYDKQEQRSLATSLHNQVFDYGRTVSNLLATIRSYFTSDLLSPVVVVIGLGIGSGHSLLRQEDLAIDAWRIQEFVGGWKNIFERPVLRAAYFVDGATRSRSRQTSNAARVCKLTEVERRAPDHARLQPCEIWRSAAVCHRKKSRKSPVCAGGSSATDWHR